MRKALLLAAAVFLLSAGTAQAFVWHLSFYKAKAATKSYERENCERDAKCIAYGASCERISESRIDCLGGTVDETAYGELECTSVYHWGVNRAGYTKLRIGHPRCYYLE
jgi:hypothetical protein